MEEVVRKLGVVMFLLAIAGMLSGCGGGKSAPAPKPMDLDVKVGSAANDGKVFYMVVRSLTDKQFMTDSYQDVAGLAFSEPPDPSVLGTFALIPGKNETLKVMKPTQNSLALYFLFTNPSDQWKNIEGQPLAKAYSVALGKDQVAIQPKKKSLLMRILWPF